MLVDAFKCGLVGWTVSLLVENTDAAREIRPDDVLVVRTDEEQVVEIELVSTGKRLDATGRLV